MAATGAFPAAEVVVGFAAGVGAGGAEAPALGFVEVRVDLIDPHAPALGIELAIGHQFADGHVGGAFVAQGRQLLTAAAIARAAREFAPEHRFERHTRFRKGVVGQEALIGEHRQQGAAIELLAQLVVGALLAADGILGFLLLGGEAVLGPLAELVVAIAQLAGLSTEALAFGHQIPQPGEKLFGKGSFEGAGTARFSGGEQKVAQVVAAGGLHLLPEERQETLQQIDLMDLHPLQPGVGKQGRDGAASGLLHPIEHRLELAR